MPSVAHRPRRGEVIDAIVGALREQHAVLRASAAIARDEATHEETRQEGRYDTRAIEASYLAGAQAQRAAELTRTIGLFERLERGGESREQVQGPCLVGLEAADGSENWYFLGPSAGGLKVEQGGVSVRVLTLQSPLGSALLGASLDDEVGVGADGARYVVVAIE